MATYNILYPELIRSLRIAERKLSRTLLSLPSGVPSGVAFRVSTALEDVRSVLKYLNEH